MEREKLGSRLGFILLSAGCAIGIGNVWKFPWMVGQYGGGLFVLVYLLFLIIMGVPIMTMEFAVGRASQKSPAKMFGTLTPQKRGWQTHGYAALVGNIILMMFYTVVSGWMLYYFVKMAKGDFVNQSASQVVTQHGQMMSDPVTQIIFTAIVVIIGTVVCMLGVKNSLEKVTKVLMIALLFIMIGLAIYCLTLSGAGEGLKFYFIPNFEYMAQNGITVFDVIEGAMKQAFFTLSLGIGSMAIFGSYLDKNRSLMGEAVNVAVLDTFVAITAGLIIFPACFTYNNGVVDAGPPLIFQTLPNIFSDMGVAGRILGSFFFIFLSFAALSTVFAVFENIFACVMDLTGWSRKKTSIICGIGLFILSIPCVLGFNVLAGFTPFGEDTAILDLEDFIVSNVILPIGSLVFVLFCTLKCGWGYDNFIEEANQGKGLKVKKWMKGYIKYVLPVLTLIFTIISIVTFFA
ncbi:MAG: sodium-dependent transporter [Clostridia bacterium]|nr:sodium-dependent transporter [Clostridia bacterium]